MKSMLVRFIGVSGFIVAVAASATGQEVTPSATPNGSGGTLPATFIPVGYLIGQEDVLSIVFWREKEMSADVVVRPDGKISLPLLNDIQAAGFTPEQLRAQIEKAASKYIEDPNATVIVKAINSRKVHIIGNVGKPGTYTLAGEMTVLQLIALAGGLQEYAQASGARTHAEVQLQGCGAGKEPAAERFAPAWRYRHRSVMPWQADR
jgi:protein involved in polysaccharide export with SLBB domain